MKQTLKILYYYFRTRRCLRFSKPQLKKWQEKHHRALLAFATTHSPFYRKHLDMLMNKKIMMDNFSEINTKGIKKSEALTQAISDEQSRHFDGLLNGVTVGLSSGTSGNQGLFLASEDERAAWCGNILAKTLPKAPWKPQKIALFLRANSPLYQTIKSKALSFAYFDLLEEVSHLKEKLQIFNPDILVAPPSMLLMLIGSCTPSRVVSVAETLLSHEETILERAFNQKIFQIYQATEGFLGFTCSHGTMHLNEDLLIIEKEYIDDQRFIPIITDIFRKTQPIIRYRLDDILVEKKTPCTCGCVFQALERIEGRCDDLLYVQTIEGRSKPLFPDFISRKIIAASKDLDDYEVIQTKIDQWEIFVLPQFRQVVLKELLTLFEQIQCVPPEIIFLDTPSPKLPGAKKRKIKRAYETLQSK